MQNKMTLIKISYHFITEGMIAFLLMFPIFYYVYNWVPYYVYIGSILIVTAFFWMITRFSNSFIPYIATAPLLFGWFYLLDFPLVMSLLLSGILIWRYIRIRHDDLLENEMLYIQWIAAIVLVLVLFFQQYEAIVYLIVPFFSMLIGFYLSHTILTKQAQQRAFLLGTLKLLALFIGIGGVTLFILQRFFSPLFMMIWDTAIVKLWDLILDVILFLLSIPVFLFDFFGIDIQKPSDEMELDIGEPAKQSKLETMDINYPDNAMQYIYGAIIVILIILTVYFLYKMAKRKFVAEPEQEVNITVHHTKEIADKRTPIWQQLRGNLGPKPTHPVRKMVLKFERKRAKQGLGRQSFETIQDWAKRIELNATIQTYEKVRYGDTDVSKEEAEQLRQELKDWEQKSQKNN